MSFFKKFSTPKESADVQDTSILQGNDELKRRYKRADLDFVKLEKDYHFQVKRYAPEDSARYLYKNGQWQQEKTREKNRAVLLCAGDLMCEPVLSQAAYCDGQYFFQPMFKHIRAILKNSDLAIANLETMTTELVPYAHEMHVIDHHTGPRYHCNAPLSYLDALRFAGFDGFVMANNHDADGGYEGIVDTIENVDKRQFMRTGMFRNALEPRALLVDINGIRVAILSYTEHINRKLDEEILTPEGCEVMLNHFSSSRVREDVARVRSQGAEFVLSYIHFLGKEYSNVIIQRNRDTAQAMADAGVDCVVGTHMHAVQGYEILTASDGRRVPVMYSLGNFISSDAHSVAKESVIYRLVLEKTEKGVTIRDESYIPLRTIECFQKTWYEIIPVQRMYNKESSELLEKAERNIAGYMGEQIQPYASDARVTTE